MMLSHLASACGRCVADARERSRGEPEWNQLGIEAQPAVSGICNAGEVLETDEGDSPSVHHELTGVCGTDSYHQHDIDVRVDLQQSSALLFGVSARESRHPFARASCEDLFGPQARLT